MQPISNHHLHEDRAPDRTSTERKPPTAVQPWFIAFIVVLNYVSYSSWTIWNKKQFKNEGKDLSILLTAYQMFYAGGISWFLQGMSQKWYPRSDMSERKLFVAILPLGIVRSADIGFGNAALATVSVAMQQIVKSTIPVYVSVLTVTVLQRALRRHVWLTLLPIVGGTLLAAWGEISAHWVGVVMAILSCIARAGKSIWNDILLHGSKGNGQLTPVQLIGFESPLSGMILLCVGLLFQGAVFVERFGTPGCWFFDPDRGAEHADVCSTQGSLVGLVLTNSCIGGLMFLNQWTYMSIIKTTSAMSCSILMNLKMVTLISVSVFTFGTHLGALNWCGIAIASAGCIAYANVTQQLPTAPAGEMLEDAASCASEAAGDRKTP